MYRSLGEFLRALEIAGELVRVGDVVSPELEISAVAGLHARQRARRVSDAARAFDPNHCDRGGAALLFERVEGCDFPVAINVFGSYHRMEMALGCAQAGGFAAIARRLTDLTTPQPPRSPADLLRMGRMLLPLLRTPARTVRSGPCQEVVRRAERGEVDLARLPLIKCWPHDGDATAMGIDFTPAQSGTSAGRGRYITFAGMHTIHADDEGVAKPASHNVGMYRAQLVDSTRLAMHWHVHHDGAAHWRSWKRAGRPMPIAICLGGEPVLPYAATAPMPPGVSELLMAGFLNGRGIPLVHAKTVPLRVPANSEIVIEGWVSTECGSIGWDPAGDEPLGPGAVFEGPFGDHTGFYSLPDRYPIVEVSAVTHRRGAVFPATIVGPPPQEDYYLGKATERIFLPLLKTIVPDIDDYHLPRFGCFHNCAFVRIAKAYPLHARRVMHAIWGAGQMAWTKMIVVVDGDVDVHDESAVLEALARRCHLRRDVEIVNGPLDILDHAAPRLGAGHKIGFDATRTWPGEEVAGIGAAEAPALPGADDVAAALRGVRGQSSIEAAVVPDLGHGRFVFVGVDKKAPGEALAAIERVWNAVAAPAADLVVAVDARVDVGSWEQVLFHMCANSDAGRDLLRMGNRLGIDATTKLPGDEREGQPVRPFPPILEMDESVVKRVAGQGRRFGLG